MNIVSEHLDSCWDVILRHLGVKNSEAKGKTKVRVWREDGEEEEAGVCQTGKRLMAKCRMLLQENEELGKMIASGRTAKLEGEIALQKTLVQEMKKNQQELDEFVGELEADVEGMQCMIYLLQTQLKETKEQLAKVSAENELLMNKKTSSDHDPGGTEKDLQKDIKPSPTKPVIFEKSDKEMLTVTRNSSEVGQVASVNILDVPAKSMHEKEPMQVDKCEPVETHILTADSTSHLESTGSSAKSWSPKNSKMDTSDSNDTFDMSHTSPQTSKKDTSAWNTCEPQNRDDGTNNKTNDSKACNPSSLKKDNGDPSPDNLEQDTKDFSPRHPAQGNSHSPKKLANDTRSWSPDNCEAMDLSNCKQSSEDASVRNSVRDWTPRISDKTCDDWSPKNSTKDVDCRSPPNRTKDTDEAAPGNPKSDPDIISMEDSNSRTDNKPEIVMENTTAHTDAEKTIHVPNGVEPLTHSEAGVE
ncbi:pre-mRNA-splicing regulator WTAP-like isoform X2 [Gigantopelta aegis]|uniref:pre-mRNA-splicing regulator WTAP-like isoform X2 n=1 Tax=Gigantopelta aegis TaxID=1735272 RepID=UPI001B88A346|nr:pre-mRNA-splicing regulator WTAP-like isoform X2 [Gigantopelta aegis]